MTNKQLQKLINIIIIVILCMLLLKVLYLKGEIYTEALWDLFDGDMQRNRIRSHNRNHKLEDSRDTIINEYCKDMLVLIAQCKIQEAFNRHYELLKSFYVTKYSIQNLTNLHHHMIFLAQQLTNRYPNIYYLKWVIHVYTYIHTKFPILIKSSTLIVISLYLHNILVALLVLKLFVYIYMVYKEPIKAKK